MTRTRSVLKRVLIMAGGTGGHVFPGLAMAKRFLEAGVQVHWLGTAKGLEADLVPKEGIPLHLISVGGLRNKSLLTKVRGFCSLLQSITQSLNIIRQLKPDLILGMGGFASGPGGIAAWLLRKKLIIHEQNAKPGLTNRVLAHLATSILEGFPNTFKGHKNVFTTGNPVRQELLGFLAPAHRFANRPSKMHLLVLGGSLGANSINNLLISALSIIPPAERPAVYHQTGLKHYTTMLAAYEKAGIDAKIVPFINEMERAYDWADVVLCRAGALTIAELCVTGLGALLVPYPYAADDHQTANADIMVRHNAAGLMPESDLTVEKLANAITTLYHAADKRKAMAEAAYQLREIKATDNVLKICEEILS